MVVDDQSANLLLVRRILSQAGFTQIRGFKDPRAALENCRSWDPDVILLDLHMPHLGGIGFLEAFRNSIAATEFVPVLMLTADVSGLALKQSLAAGANDFATKPVDAVELLLRVRNLLAIRLCHQELKQHNATLAAALHAHNSSDERVAAIRAAKIAAIEDVII
ncbi:MAG: response regulator, partial [Thermoanaerobaculia bacterium]